MCVAHDSDWCVSVLMSCLVYFAPAPQYLRSRPVASPLQGKAHSLKPSVKEKLVGSPVRSAEDVSQRVYLYEGLLGEAQPGRPCPEESGTRPGKWGR